MKERLVGAAVLVAIGVWLIPWVLDGPESAIESGSASVQLPAVEEPMPIRTQTLTLGEPATAESPPLATPPAAVEPSAVPPPTRDTPTRETARDTEIAAAPTTVAAPPPPKPAPSDATAGDWIVQLGTFGEEANARRLAQRTGTFGYEADVSTYRANGRTLYRVRVGPATTRGRADAVASALRAHGIDEARVVAAR